MPSFSAESRKKSASKRLAHEAAVHVGEAHYDLVDAAVFHCGFELVDGQHALDGGGEGLGRGGGAAGGKRRRRMGRWMSVKLRRIESGGCASQARVMVIVVVWRGSWQLRGWEAVHDGCCGTDGLETTREL